MLFKRHLLDALVALVLISLVGVGWLAYRSMQTAAVSDQWETHSRVVMQEWGALLSSLQDAETGQRGFIITGNPDYLQPYQAGLSTAPIRLADLRRLTADNPQQQQRLDAITPLVAAKFAELKETIALRETQGFPAASAVVMTQSGKKIMDQLRELVAEAQAEEAQLLKGRIATYENDTRKTMQSVLLGGSLGALALLLLFIRLRWELASRSRAETASLASEQRYQSLFNSIDEGFCIIDMIFDDHQKPVDFRFLEVNPAFEKQSGIRDGTGRRMRELAPDIEAYWSEICGKVALTGESVRYVNEAKALDDRWFDIYAFRLGGPESRKVAVLFTNITARKQAEQALDRLNVTLELRVQERTAELSQANADLQAEIAAKELLRESQERLLTVAENLTEGLCITSMEGEFIHWNRASLEMHGFASMAECMGQLAGFSKLVEVNTLAGAPLPFDQWPMSRALRGEVVRNCELRIRRTDTGMERILSYSGSTVRDGAGKQSAFLTVTDITERKRTEAQLRELNDTLERRVFERTQDLAELHRRKDEFLAMLSHELRNPLAALSNAVQLLRLQKHEEPLQQQGRAIIERQVRHLKHLVDDLLEVSRIATGNVRLRQQQVSVAGVVERAVETAQPLLAQRRQELTLSLPPQAVWLHADGVRLEQVLVNLLANAAKYTDEGGRIWLSVEQQSAAELAAQGSMALSMVVIRVRDNGIGIASELLPHIFDLFTQAERSLDRSQGGLGIGLALVRQLVAMHGGTVEAHSVLGRGSEFVVRLPLMATALPPLAAPSPVLDTAQPPEKASTSCKVLVVDDNVDAAQSLAVLLEMTGHAVSLAYDGPTALRAAIDERPDVLLLDIGLPGLDGFEVAQRIRQQPALEGLVLVALTGYGQEADRQRALDAGFDHHLVKPADIDEIEKILLTVTKKHHVRRNGAELKRLADCAIPAAPATRLA